MLGRLEFTFQPRYFDFLLGQGRHPSSGEAGLAHRIVFSLLAHPAVNQVGKGSQASSGTRGRMTKLPKEFDGLELEFGGLGLVRVSHSLTISKSLLNRSLVT